MNSTINYLSDKESDKKIENSKFDIILLSYNINLSSFYKYINTIFFGNIKLSFTIKNAVFDFKKAYQPIKAFIKKITSIKIKQNQKIMQTHIVYNNNIISLKYDILYNKSWVYYISN